ncbi:MAG: peroxiredoxin [Minisyncoccia bacterium]
MSMRSLLSAAFNLPLAAGKGKSVAFFAKCYNGGMNDEEPRVGTIAPDFVLPDQNGVDHTLVRCRGHWVFLYFYPKDDSPECAAEACAIRDSFPEFRHFGVEVLGVSPDDVASHKRFVEKYHLPFSLLADIHKKAARSYGVVAKHPAFGEREGWVMRVSFLIDLIGEVEKIYDDILPKIQVKKVLADLEAARTG